jgi:hypothetical protein
LEVDTQGPTFSNLSPELEFVTSNRSQVFSVDIGDPSGIDRGSVLFTIVVKDIGTETFDPITTGSHIDGFYLNVQASLNLTLPAGEHEWAVTATDNIGNSSTWGSTDLIWEIPSASSRYTLELSVFPPEAAAWGAKVSGGKKYRAGRVAHPGATVQTECIKGQRYLFSKWRDVWTGIHWDVQNPTNVDMNKNQAIEAVYRKSSSSCPNLAAEPAEWYYGSILVDQTVDSVNIEISNAGAATLEWELISWPDWIDIAEPSELKNVGDNNILAGVRPSLPPDNYSGVISIESNGGNITIPISISITLPATAAPAAPTPTQVPPTATPTPTPAPAVTNGRIAFRSYRDGNDEIYVMNADGSDQTRLTNNSGEDGSPV